MCADPFLYLMCGNFSTGQIMVVDGGGVLVKKIGKV